MPAAVKCEINLNRLYVTLSGVIAKKELESIYVDIRFCVADLQPGFIVINDFSTCTFGHLNGIPVFKKIMNFLMENEVSRVIRVTGKRRLIFKQISRISDLASPYEVEYAETLEEANQMLEGESKAAVS